MARYRNVSVAPWRRADGKLVPPGATFEATEREHARIQRRPVYQRRLELQAKIGGPATAASTEAEVWPLKMKPEKYLQLYPNGPKAAQAERMLLEVSK